MSLQNEVTHCLSKISVSPSPTAIALESTLQQCLANLKELLSELHQLHIESENYKAELMMLKEKCDSKNCSGSEALKKDIESKDNKIQFAASVLTKLNETKNFMFLTEAFKILCGDSSSNVMNAADSQDSFKIENKEKTARISPNVKKKTPKKVLSTSIEDVSMNEESISEIDGTPTAPLSPIIQSKVRSSTLVNSLEARDKKKCPENWSTPEAKSIKLLIKTSSRGRPGRGKLRQQRLPFTMDKPSCVVDLTSSPEFCRGSRGKTESSCNVQKLIKKESSENDDTILPSPTSGPAHFLSSTSKDNQTKFKKPLLSLTRVKHEEMSCPVKTEPTDVTEMEDSINILNPNRFPINGKASVKKEQEKPRQEDITHCEPQASMSLLQHVNKLEQNDNVPNSVILCCHSPKKRPLAENINIANMLPAQDGDSSMSLLSREQVTDKSDGIEDNAIRKTPEKVEPVYKEPAVRKKAEKRALPAWCCDECESFFGILYANEPEKRAKQIASCSKHRGRTNPARPKTPPGFWHPRWEVPDDTEEFNKRNNAV